VKLLRLLRLPASPIEDSLTGRVFVLAGFAVADVAIVLYGQDYVVPALGLVAAAAGHLFSYRERNGGRPLWRQLLLAGLMVAALTYLLADSMFALFGGVLPQANFAILLLAITSFDLKTRRNCYSSLWISLAILYLAAVYAWDYTFGFLAALWIVCLAGFWTASYLRSIRAEGGGPRGALTAAAAGALIVGLLIFVTVPQPSGLALSPLIVSLPSYTSFRGDIEGSVLPLVQLSGDASGATSNVDLHFRGRLGDAPVMYVRTGVPAYWRGLVFDTYSNGSWTASSSVTRNVNPYVPSRLLPPEPAGSLGTFVQVFHILRPLPGVLDAAYPIQSLYAPFGTLRQDAYGTFHTPVPLSPGQTYSVVSYLPNLSPAVLRAAEMPSTEPLPTAAGVYLEADGLSSRARSLASQVTSGASNEYDIVLALTNYLQHNYHYSLQLSPVPAGRDPVDWFLFDAKTGYCEQFASAETLMLRSLGIPARLATGYSTGDYNAVLDQSVVREKDAHAWVEVWFADHGWVPVDPTPGVPPVAAATFPDHWAASSLTRLIPNLQIGAPVAVLGSLGALAAVPATVAAGLVVGLAFVLLWAWLRRRFRMWNTRPPPGESELLRLYDRVQRKLGSRRAPQQTPLEYLDLYQKAHIGLLLSDVTEAVNEGAYAGRWPDPDQVREMAERLS
jgi:protein-glutamine gamma-glutamyltransferase